MGSQDRPTVDITTPVGGWQRPWPAVGELAAVLEPGSWTLVGGLMTQLHTIDKGLDTIRPTDDVDIVLHIETTRGLPDATSARLQAIGYRLRNVIDPRANTAHRFVRGRDIIDLVTTDDVVDVLIADHPAPSIVEPLLGRRMVRIEGGTQALRRTINARLEIEPGIVTTISVPRPFGAVILKAAAYESDSRDRDRHLVDAAALLACVDDPLDERDRLAGSDLGRLQVLQQALPDDHRAWLRLPAGTRRDARAALRLLARP